MEFLIDDDKKENLSGIGLLALRLSAGLMMLFAHGLGKIENFGGVAENFDGLLGMPGTINAVLVIFAEVLCAILIMGGALTRLAAIPLVIAMLVASYAHAIMWGDPFGDYELALLYAGVFLTLAFTGPGKFSIDAVLSNNRNA